MGFEGICWWVDHTISQQYNANSTNFFVPR